MDSIALLKITHEGTSFVKNSKLHILTTSFEELGIKDDEKFDEFYAKLNHIVNQGKISAFLSKQLARSVMNHLMIMLENSRNCSFMETAKTLECMERTR